MLAETAYGKCGVRLVQVMRPGDRHALKDLTVGVRFEGEYDASYAGDNSDVLPTETMKNTVYALAARRRIEEPEPFALMLAEHFLDHNPHLRRVTIDITEHPWARVTTGEKEHDHAFVRQGCESRTAQVRCDRQEAQIRAGIAGLLVLKTAGSAFAGFMRDAFTTLQETRDRLLATALTATWRYDAGTAYGRTTTTVGRCGVPAAQSASNEQVQRHVLHRQHALPVASTRCGRPDIARRAIPGRTLRCVRAEPRFPMRWQAHRRLRADRALPGLRPVPASAYLA
jgi:urate oxidase